MSVICVRLRGTTVLSELAGLGIWLRKLEDEKRLTAVHSFGWGSTLVIKWLYIFKSEASCALELVARPSGKCQGEVWKHVASHLLV